MGFYDRRVPARLGQFGDIAKDVAKEIVIAVTPQLKELTAAAAEAAKPTIIAVVREDLIPAAAPWIVVGFIALGAVAAIIGGLLARKCKVCA